MCFVELHGEVIGGHCLALSTTALAPVTRWRMPHSSIFYDAEVWLQRRSANLFLGNKGEPQRPLGLCVRQKPVPHQLQSQQPLMSNQPPINVAPLQMTSVVCYCLLLHALLTHACILPLQPWGLSCLQQSMSRISCRAVARHAGHPVQCTREACTWTCCPSQCSRRGRCISQGYTQKAVKGDEGFVSNGKYRLACIRALLVRHVIPSCFHSVLSGSSPRYKNEMCIPR